MKKRELRAQMEEERNVMREALRQECDSWQARNIALREEMVRVVQRFRDAQARDRAEIARLQQELAKCRYEHGKANYESQREAESRPRQVKIDETELWNEIARLYAMPVPKRM